MIFEISFFSLKYIYSYLVAKNLFKIFVVPLNYDVLLFIIVFYYKI